MKEINGSIKFRVKILILIGLLSMVLIWSLPTSNAETTFESFPEFKEGDYFRYEFDENLYFDIEGDYIKGSEVIGYENQNLDMYIYEIIGEEKITIDNKTYDCVIVKNEWKMSVTYLLNEGTSDNDKINWSYNFSSKEWWLKSDQTKVKEERTQQSELSYISQGEFIIEGSESIDKVTYMQIGKDLSFPLTIGKTWKSEIEKKSNYTGKYRTTEEKWEEYSSETSINESINFEVISEKSVKVKAGTFDCLKIKIQKDGEDHYQVQYFTKNGFVTKIEFYDPDDSLRNKLELTSYKMKNEIANDDLNFKLISMVIFVVAIMSFIIIFIVKKKSSRYVTSQNREQLYSQKQYQQYQQPLQQFQQQEMHEQYQELQQQSQAQICSFCEQTLRYIDEYQKWYCDFCQRYV